jgi:hypothetical protein
MSVVQAQGSCDRCLRRLGTYRCPCCGTRLCPKHRVCRCDSEELAEQVPVRRRGRRLQNGRPHPHNMTKQVI